MRAGIIIVAIIITLALIGWQESAEFAQREYDRGYDEGALVIISELEAGENIEYITRDGKHRYNVEVFNDLSEWMDHEEDSLCANCHTYDTKYLRKEV